jgi:hypothetical protein
MSPSPEQHTSPKSTLRVCNEHFDLAQLASSVHPKLVGGVSAMEIFRQL